MKNIIASVVIVLLILIGLFNVATMDDLKYLDINYWFPGSYASHYLGSFTQLASSDKMSAFPTTYNANLAKTIEVGTTTIPTITTLSGLTTANALTSATSLSSIGTITSGIWNGTIIDELYGGTGTSSPTGILWGNGTNLYQIASGTANQVLTSNGANSAPTFQTYAVDQTGNYTWTGVHAFATTTTIGSGAQGGLAPPGTIVTYASTTAPAGWLLCDGTSYATSTYPGLFTVIGYGYGGTGANFNVPDARGRNVLMASTTANIGQKAGESSHTMTISELVAHTHNMSSGGPGGVGATIGTAGVAGVPTESTGSSVPFNVLDPYIVMQMIIKY